MWRFCCLSLLWVSSLIIQPSQIVAHDFRLLKCLRIWFIAHHMVNSSKVFKVHLKIICILQLWSGLSHMWHVTFINVIVQIFHSYWFSSVLSATERGAQGSQLWWWICFILLLILGQCSYIYIYCISCQVVGFKYYLGGSISPPCLLFSLPHFDIRIFIATFRMVVCTLHLSLSFSSWCVCVCGTLMEPRASYR